MKRIPFSQVLKNTKTDIRIEYDRLYDLFCLQKYGEITPRCLKDICANSFLSFPFRGTCISLNDFDVCHGYNFTYTPSDFNLDYLVSFCEYSYNIVFYCDRNNNNNKGFLPTIFVQAIKIYIQQIKKVIEKIGYMSIIHDGITDFVPKDQAAISVAEIVDPNLSYKVIEYNHHSMKGDIERKRATLIVLADKLEPLRSKLKQASASLESDLFLLLNSVNVRHNNSDSSGNKYISYVAAMKEEEIEQWYDNIYQMCLLAFLELDHLDRKKSIEQLKKDIQKK